MNEKIVILLLACLVLAFYAGLGWLVAFLAVLTVLAALVPGPAKAKHSAKAPSEETVLHPVIYEESGGPSPYPEYQQITVQTGWPPGHSDAFEKITYSIGNLLKLGKKGVKKAVKGIEE